jgi:hypothetical protein
MMRDQKAALQPRDLLIKKSAEESHKLTGFYPNMKNAERNLAATAIRTGPTVAKK